MYYSKSDTLDEFRYQIGIYGEKIKEARKLITKVNQLITSEKYIYRNSCYYICKNNGFYLFSLAGYDPRPYTIPFGENELTMCAVRGSFQLVTTPQGTNIYIPSYDGHHLLGILWVHSDQEQDINEDDCIFLTEVVNYVNRKIMEHRND